jgi:hypothetical protein
MINVTTKVSVPSAFVTKGRQRIKQFNDIVYLKNGDEFEIELFNPIKNKVLAKISINGISLGTGIVLRPGERVFLERYLDVAKKFLFETYNVDGNDSNVKEAIKNNGNVEVEFFEESKPPIYYVNYSYTNYQRNTDPGIFFKSTNNNLNETRYSKGISSTSNSYETSYNSCEEFDCSAELETGRIEKGSTSQQEFNQDSTTFNSWVLCKSIWKILPESQRVFTKEDLKIFCTNCGAKRKKSSYRFCPNCGIEF